MFFQVLLWYHDSTNLVNAPALRLLSSAKLEKLFAASSSILLFLAREKRQSMTVSVIFLSSFPLAVCCLLIYIFCLLASK